MMRTYSVKWSVRLFISFSFLMRRVLIFWMDISYVVVDECTDDDRDERERLSSADGNALTGPLATGLSLPAQGEIRIALSDVVSFRCHVPSLGSQTFPYVLLTVNGAANPPFFFHDGGMREFRNLVRMRV